MSLSSLQNHPDEPAHTSSIATTARLAGSVAASSATSALVAIAAAQALATTAEASLATEQFLDELAHVVAVPLTGYQREKIGAALIEAIDARIVALLRS